MSAPQSLLKKRKMFTLQEPRSAPRSYSVWRASDLTLVSCDDGALALLSNSLALLFWNLTLSLAKICRSLSSPIILDSSSLLVVTLLSSELDYAMKTS